MTYMKTVIDGFKAAGRDQIKFAIGGAPISQMFADEISADGYGQNASSAVDLFLHFAGKGSAPSQAKKIAPAAASAGPVAGGKVTTYKILYWQEIPSQIKAEDDAGNELSLELPAKFAERIDAAAQKRGFGEADAYTAQWKWSEPQERAGSAADVVASLRAELEAKADW
jgi:hypothetical protein